MVEPEMAYAELDDVMTLAEDMIVYVVERVLDTRRQELQTLERDVSKLESVRTPFPRISYDDAVGGTEKEGKQNRVGRRLRRYGRNAGQRGLRPPGCRAPIPDGDQGLLYAAGIRCVPSWRSASTCSLRKATVN